MSSTALGVVAGVVVFSIGGLHGLLVLTAAVVSWWIVRSACTWLLVQQPAQKSFVGRRTLTITMILLFAVLAATLAPHLLDQLASRVTAQRSISPIAAVGWLLMVLTPLGLAYWVFIGADEGRRRPGKAEQAQAEQQQQAHRQQEQERQADERRRQAEQAEQAEQTEQEREAERRRRQQRERAAQQLEKKAWWSVLEVSPHASADEIRHAYHRKIKQCHPDRVAGLAPEFIELAERHTQSLNAAYGAATRAHRATQAT